MPSKRRTAHLEISNNNSNQTTKSQSSGRVPKRRTLNRNVARKKAQPYIIPIVQPPTVTGDLFVFGTGDTGQLGLGEDMLERQKPMTLNIPQCDDIVDVACGGLHSIAASKDGKLWSWGCNDQSALGRSGDEYIPALVENLDGVNVIKVVCCDSATLALSNEGVLYCWGTFRGNDGILGFSNTTRIQEKPAIYEPLNKLPISDIAAGSDHCMALAKDGRVFLWGNGEQFQLGRRIVKRRALNGLFPETLKLRNIKLIGCGAFHSFAVDENNTLYAWGLNNFYQCGVDNVDGQDFCITKPTAVTGLSGKGQIKSVHGGTHHTAVLMEDGRVYSFGRGDSAQLGLPADLLEQIKVAEEGSTFKIAVDEPTIIPNLTDVVALDIGTNHAVAVDASGQAYTWGFGESYALGNKTGKDEQVPYSLTGQKIEGRRVLRVAAGAQHSVILASK